jgi:hypothetical protein
MGYNDLETNSKNLHEAGVLSDFRNDTEFYADKLYVSYNYMDTEVYNRKIRELEGPQLSLNSEYNIFDNFLIKDFDTKLGLVDPNSDKQLFKFNSDNILESIVNYKQEIDLTPHLSVKYNGPMISAYLHEGKYYDVIQKEALSGHLFTERGYVAGDFWDDTTFENVFADYNSLIYSDENYVELDYSDALEMQNKTLEINGYYANNNWLTEPSFIRHINYAAYSFSKDDDKFVHVIYNPDMPFVNTFYLGDEGPLQYYIIPSNEIQPYIDHIKIYNYNRTKLKKQYVMYYGGIVAGVADSTKIHHVQNTNADRDVISTFYYDYDALGNIITIREEF